MDPQPASADEVDAVVTEYRNTVEVAAMNGDELLIVLADYGKRWEVIVEVDAPLDEPFSVRVLEERPVEVRRKWVGDTVALGDARTAHIEVRVGDPGLEIAAYEVQALDGNVVGVPILEAVRDTPEVFAVYTSEEAHRPHFVHLRVRLGLRVHIRLARRAIQALVLFASVAALFYPEGRDLVGAMGVIALPATFAVTVLLTRDPNPMTGLVERTARAWLLISLAALLAIVGWRLFTATPVLH